MEYMEDLNSISPTFNASFNMVKTDGNASYTHDVYDFVLTGELTSNANYTVFSGTSTITMIEGPVTEVPTTIALWETVQRVYYSIHQRLTIIARIQQSMVLIIWFV